MKWLAMLALVAAPVAARADSVGNCHVGAYRLSDGRVVDLAPTAPDQLRWRMLDGSTGALTAGANDTWTSTLGWTTRADGLTVTLGDCATGKITFGGRDGQRIVFDVRETRVAVAGSITLAGRLVMPAVGDKVPLVVLIHGSEHESARDGYALQRLLPAEGIGVFVYDKRGTGASGGSYTQDFGVLADDAVAALAAARALAGPRAGRVGLQGGSQGGWVAPLAATRAAVDFVVVSFGLAVSPLEEDTQAVELEMKLAGHAPAEVARALEVAHAAQAVMASDLTTGFHEFAVIRDRYQHEPWFKDLHGNFTWALLPYPEAELRAKAPAYRFHTPWTYDALPVLRAVRAPSLWILGEDDLDAPSAETSRRLQRLIAGGRPITLAMFPRAEHGMTEYERGADGKRVSTRYAPGYFAMLRDFIRDGRLHGTYGAARLTVSKAPRR
ncbi:MAG TPA: alpha/beta hydrolase [Kofleriaceae bacterium]